MMELMLNGIGVDCIIGDLPDERVRLQRLRVDAVLEIPDTAGETDELSDTVDYAALAEDIRAGLVAAECRMIERAAKLAAERCLAADSSVAVATVTVTKAGAVNGLDSAAVRYRMVRDRRHGAL